RAIEALVRHSSRFGATPGPLLEFGAAWEKREFIVGAAGADGEWADFVGVYVLNRGTETAKGVWAELEFETMDGTPIIRFQGRWSHAPMASLGDPFEAPRFTQTNVPPNAKPEPLDVALRFESDRHLYGMNTRNLFSGGRHEI